MASPDRTKTLLSITVDLVMLALILANLALIIFDWMFLNATFQSLLQTYVPGFFTFYDTTIHANFFYIDLVFVGVFITEILIRWTLAIIRQRYYRWWFYPFIHWYDVLGCIPISSFRALRVLRIFAVIPKVQRLGIFDLTKTYVYGKYMTYRDALIEEITDRVTAQILEGVQEGVQQGHPVTERIIEDAILPREQALIDAFAHRIQEAVASGYAPHRSTLKSYVDERVADAVANNAEVQQFAQLPGVGRPLRSLLEGAISDIVFHIIDDMLHDVASLENDTLVAKITEASSAALIRPQFDPRFNRILRDMIVHSLDLIKEQVEIKQWKLENVAQAEVTPA